MSYYRKTSRHRDSAPVRPLCIPCILGICLFLISCLASGCHGAGLPAGGNTAGVSAQKESEAAFSAASTASDSVSDVSFADSALQDRILSKVSCLHEEYDLQILYGNEIRQTFRDYKAKPLLDPARILEALDVLDRVLTLYPPGYFSSVRKGFCTSITVCLAKDLHAIDDDSYLESAHAFTTVQDDTIWLVLNAEDKLQAPTLIHELTHVTDYRLLDMRELRESEWNRLNPKSFSYYNAYLDEYGNDLRVTGSSEYTSLYEKDPEQIWFYDSYGKTYAMEDRARLMEKLLEGPADETPFMPADRCFSSPHVQKKLRFYFYTLRQTLGTGQWPEKTSWEAALQSIEQEPAPF